METFVFDLLNYMPWKRAAFPELWHGVVREIMRERNRRATDEFWRTHPEELARHLAD
jgi:hypothetical protein